MKIWVIGSQGMLGSALLRSCQKKGIEAIGTSRIEANITDLTHLQKISLKIRPTHIVNCAAFTDVDGAESQSEAAFAINAQGAGHAASVARQSQAHLVHVSTDYVFSGQGTRPYLEDDACAPINTYGKSKHQGEMRVLETLPTACILRTSWLFGSQGKNFISSIFKWLQERDAVQVVVDQCGRPTFCPDLADAILTLLNAEGIFHFANTGERSRYQIACDVRDKALALGYPLKCREIMPVPSSQFKTPAMRPTYSVLDTTKYTHLTKHTPRSWDEVANNFFNYAL